MLRLDNGKNEMQPLYTAGKVRDWRMTVNPIWKPFVIFASLVTALVTFLPGLSPYAVGQTDEIVIVAYGDSLTAGYQLPPGDAFPVQLEKALRGKGHNVRVINAGVSGDTAADGLARFDWTMPEEADALILELGANDALRGIPLAETTSALEGILKRAGEKKLNVLIAGMEAPRNWGPSYVADFRAMYESLAQTYNTLLYPFFLDGVALDSALNLGDGIHPTGKGVAKIVERILPKVEELIARVKTAREKAS